MVLGAEAMPYWPVPMRAYVPLAVIALAACASEAGFDARMQPLVGRSETDLVAALGVPNDSFTSSEGTRFLRYDGLGAQSSTTGFPAGLSFGVGGFGFSGGGVGTGAGVGYSAGWNPPAPCSVTFEIRAARVESFSKRGSGCVAQPAG